MALRSEQRAAPSAARHRPPTWARVAAVPVVAALVVLGVWVTGGLVTNDEGVARVLTGGWFAVAGVVAVAVAVRRRGLAVPVLAAYAVTTALVGGFLLYSSEVDKVVDEDVVVAGPAPAAQSPTSATGTGTPSAGTGSAPKPAAAVRLASGTFVSKAHPTTGEAAVVRRPDGSLVLTLTKLDTDPGPDLRVYLVRGDGSRVSGGVDLGALKGNKGTQQYAVPATVAERDFGAVVVWCRAFSVSFGVAALSS